MKKLLLLLFSWQLLTVLSLTAQDVNFELDAPTAVSVGEEFRVVYSINAQATGFKVGAFRGFSVQMGPMQGTGSGIQIINGKVTQSYETSFTYVLQATREGTYILPSASVSANGISYASNKITVKVIAGNLPPQAQRKPDSGVSGVSASDIFLRSQVSNANPYQGEQIIVTYKLYTALPIADHYTIRQPSTPGFWMQDLLERNEKLTQYREIVNGREYTVAEMSRYALFGQKAGTFKIDPLEMEVLAQVPRSGKPEFNDPFFDQFFDDSFFGTSYQNVQKTIRSNAVTIRVKPLPEVGKTENFGGAVGTFTVNASTDQPELKANEALVLKFNVTGRGNLNLVEKPVVKFPADFEVYDPRILDNIKPTPTGLTGTRTFEYLIIPRKQGNYSIPAIDFQYFDAGGAAYRTERTAEIPVKVLKGEGEEGTFAIRPGKGEQPVGNDIRFIKTQPFSLSRAGVYFFNSTPFWILFMLPILLFTTFVFLYRNELKKRSNVAQMRNKKATRIARRRLRSAETFMKQGKHEPFWLEISNALWGYMADKFNIPRASLSMETIRENLDEKQVAPELTSQFIEVLENTEYARFAPGDKNQAMDKIYQQALNVITKTEEELK